MLRRAAATLVAVAALALAGPALGREAAPLAVDPALEARVLEIAQEMRCLVCQNETLADSQADLAVDLRQQIRERLRHGDSPAQVGDFLVSRYGEFVRYRPAFGTTTALLWAGPFVLLVGAFTFLGRQLKRSRRVASEDLSAAELARLGALRAAPGVEP